MGDQARDQSSSGEPGTAGDSPSPVDRSERIKELVHRFSVFPCPERYIHLWPNEMPAESVAWMDRKLSGRDYDPGQTPLIMVLQGFPLYGLMLLVTDRRVYYGRGLKKAFDLASVFSVHTLHKAVGIRTFEDLYIDLGHVGYLGRGRASTAWATDFCRLLMNMAVEARGEAEVDSAQGQEDAPSRSGGLPQEQVLLMAASRTIAGDSPEVVADALIEQGVSTEAARRMADVLQKLNAAPAKPSLLPIFGGLAVTVIAGILASASDNNLYFYFMVGGILALGNGIAKQLQGPKPPTPAELIARYQGRVLCW